MTRYVAFAAAALACSTALAQESRKLVTNADVLAMTKSGIGEQTIVLLIQRGATNFDTTPKALVELKAAGVPDGVLNAMLSVPKPKTAAARTPDPNSLLDEALNAIAPREKLNSIRAVR
jgi:hypothetical protein